MVFPISRYRIFSTDPAGSAKSFSKSLNLSAYQEAQEAKHQNFPSHFQRKGQSCLCPVARQPIYHHRSAARTGRRTQMGFIRGAPSPWQRHRPQRRLTHPGAGAAAPWRGLFLSLRHLFFRRQRVSRACSHMPRLVAGWHKACIVHARRPERRSNCLPWLRATICWQPSLCHYITGDSPTCKQISRTCLSSLILEEQ